LLYAKEWKKWHQSRLGIKKKNDHRQNTLNNKLLKCE